MPTLADLKRAEVYYFNIHGWHRGVVLEESDTAVLVICGQSRGDFPGPVVKVEARCQAAIAMGLKAATHFYPSNVAIIRDPSQIGQRVGRCPPNRFHQLEELAIAAGRKAAR